MENKKRSISTKTFAILLAVMLVIGCMAGGTIAWLIDSKTVTNTFTYGDINIDLFEHGYDAATNTLTGNKVESVTDYTIIPGVDLPKDPTVTVKAGSEACWLFVKVEETGTFVTDKVTYAIDNTEWTALEDVAGVYYKELNAKTAADTDYNILVDKKVTVANTLTKADITALTSKDATLTFKAYAIQKAGFATPAAAWEEASK